MERVHQVLAKGVEVVQSNDLFWHVKMTRQNGGLYLQHRNYCCCLEVLGKLFQLS